MKIGKTEIMNLIDALEKLDLRLLVAIDELKYKNDDIRVTCLHKFKNIIHVSKMNLFYLANCILEKNFWCQISEGNVADTDIKIWAREYEVNTRFSLFHLLMSNLEASLRIMARGIGSNACDKGTGNFQSIYKMILNRLKITDPDVETLLNLSRLVRNTIHNGGMYCPANSKQEFVKVQYRGTFYVFESGNPVGFLYWPFLILLANDLIDLVITMVSSPEMDMFLHIPDPAVQFL